MLHSTYDFRSYAEDAIKEYFATRAEARGIPGKLVVKRCFVDISGSGATSFYLYKAGQGLASLQLIALHDGTWRVLVTGSDDTGYEKDVATRSQAEALMRRVPVPVTMSALKRLGFRHK